MKRFNCACIQIIKMDRAIASNVGATSLIGLQQLRPLANTFQRCWELDMSTYQIHPLSIMLNGKRRHSVTPAHDIESLVKIQFAMNTFTQGFANIYGYKDCWAGHTESNNAYYQSLYFNLGRAFLKKFCSITLPYILPTTYEKLFQELP